MREITNLEATEFVATLTHPLAEYIYGVTLPSLAAMFTRLYMEKYGVTERHLAMVAVKNQNNALRNEFAHLQQEISIAGILDSPEAMTNNPYVSEPLRFFDCCPVSDGGACVILASEDVARKIDRPLVRLAGVGQATDTHAVHEREEPTDLLAVRQGFVRPTSTSPSFTTRSRFSRSSRARRSGSSRRGRGTWHSNAARLSSGGSSRSTCRAA